MTDESGVVKAKQSRSRKTHEALVQACLTLLDERPFDHLTVAEIAGGAGVSVGNFYRRFRSKEAILPDLYAEYDRRFADFYARLPENERLRAQDRATRTAAFVSAMLEFFKANRGLLQAIHLHSRLHPDIVPAGSYSQRERVYADVGSIFRIEDHAGRAAAGQMASLLLVSTLTEMILYPDQTPAVAMDLSTDDLVAELTKLLVRYVEGEEET